MRHEANVTMVTLPEATERLENTDDVQSHLFDRGILEPVGRHELGSSWRTASRWSGRKGIEHGSLINPLESTLDGRRAETRDYGSRLGRGAAASDNGRANDGRVVPIRLSKLRPRAPASVHRPYGGWAARRVRCSRAPHRGNRGRVPEGYRGPGGAQPEPNLCLRRWRPSRHGCGRFDTQGDRRGRRNQLPRWARLRTGSWKAVRLRRGRTARSRDRRSHQSGNRRGRVRG